MVSPAGGGPWSRSARLVCTRCNRPLEARAEPLSRRRRLGGAVALLTLVLAGGVVFALATLHDLRSPPAEPERSSEAGEG
jgi:hypothetical protein